MDTTILQHLDKHIAYDKKSGWLVHKTSGKAKIKGARAGATRKSGGRRIVTIRVKGRSRQVPEDRVVWYLVHRQWPMFTVYHKDGNLHNSKAENLTIEPVDKVKLAWELYREQGLSANIARLAFRYNPHKGTFEKLYRGDKWKAVKPYVDKDGYGRFRVFGQQLAAHRLAFLLKIGEIPAFIDHKNGDPSDNRWNNLREASSSDNACNSKVKSRNKIGHKNICVTACGTFQVSVAKSGKRRSYRNFDSLDKAIAFRDQELDAKHRSFATGNIRRYRNGIAQRARPKKAPHKTKSELRLL